MRIAKFLLKLNAKFQYVDVLYRIECKLQDFFAKISNMLTCYIKLQKNRRELLDLC